MKLKGIYFLLGSAIGPVLFGGCLTPQKELTHHSSLPQLVRFFSITKVQREPGALFIMGGGSAAADGGKYDFSRRSPLSSYPLIRMTLKSDDPSLLDACLQRVQAARENRQSIDIRGMGVFTIESLIDPPLETGVFTLTHLDACGVPIPPPPVVSTATVAAIPEAISAADLVAVPERYLDRNTVISGRLVSPVHFKDPVSSLTIQSEGQFLSGYFLTQSLAAESRLLLVHTTPGSGLILEGTLTRITPQSLASQSGGTLPTGNEFDISKVESVGPAQ